MLFGWGRVFPKDLTIRGRTPPVVDPIKKFSNGGGILGSNGIGSPPPTTRVVYPVGFRPPHYCTCANNIVPA